MCTDIATTLELQIKRPLSVRISPLRHTGYNDLSERPPPPSSSHSQLAGLPGVIRSGSGDPAGISGVGVVSGGVGVVNSGGGVVSSQPNPQTSSRARDRVRYIRLERALN